MKILLTGFDPFGGETVNPAFEAVKLLPDTIAGAEIVKQEVPTEFIRAGEVLEAAIQANQPDVVICIGQAGGRSAITPEKVAIVQDADAIWREEIAKAGLDKEISQYYAALTNMHSVGVMGDERTYDYAVALRAVTTTDFMTAESYDMPWDVLGTVTSRIVNEVKHVNRVFYDCTGKPPATIELE